MRAIKTIFARLSFLKKIFQVYSHSLFQKFVRSILAICKPKYCYMDVVLVVCCTKCYTQCYGGDRQLVRGDVELE